MAYDEELAARIREHALGAPVQERKMFGGLAFLIGGHLAVAASGRSGLLVRVDPADHDGLLAEPGAAPMEMGGRGPMVGWLRVDPEAVAGDAELAAWVERGLAYAGSLPPK
ncbi:MAG: TfoX/Sxy family protein [Nocardioides sp.]